MCQKELKSINVSFIWGRESCDCVPRSWPDWLEPSLLAGVVTGCHLEKVVGTSVVGPIEEKINTYHFGSRWKGAEI